MNLLLWFFQTKLSFIVWEQTIYFIWDCFCDRSMHGTNIISIIQEFNLQKTAFFMSDFEFTSKNLRHRKWIIITRILVNTITIHNWTLALCVRNSHNSNCGSKKQVIYSMIQKFIAPSALLKCIGVLPNSTYICHQGSWEIFLSVK